jgi:hypothetical protein
MGPAAKALVRDYTLRAIVAIAEFRFADAFYYYDAALAVAEWERRFNKIRMRAALSVGAWLARKRL